MSGGFLWEWELHPHECGRGGGTTMAATPWPLGAPLSPIKGPPLLLSKHTSSRRISLPPLEFPHGRGSARYMFPMDFSGRICCFRCFAGARARRLSGYPYVCEITDAPLLCGAGLDGAGPDGLLLDLEIGKRSTTSSTSTTLLTIFGLRGYVSMDVYPPVACI